MSVPHFISPPCLSHLVFHISVLLSAIPLPPLIGLSAHHRSMGIHVSARNYDHDSPYGETKSLPPSFSLSLSLVRLAQQSHLCHKLIILCILCLHKNKHFSAEVAKIKASSRSCETSVTGCTSLSLVFLSCKHAHIHSNTLVHTH